MHNLTFYWLVQLRTAQLYHGQIHLIISKISYNSNDSNLEKTNCFPLPHGCHTSISFPWSFTPADVTQVTLQQAAWCCFIYTHRHVSTIPSKLFFHWRQKQMMAWSKMFKHIFAKFPQKINTFNRRFYLGCTYSASFTALKTTILQANDAIYGAVPDQLGLQSLENI